MSAARDISRRVKMYILTCSGVCILTSLILSGGASAEPLAPRGHAAVAPEGTWSVGVFNPLTWVPVEGLEVQTHPLLTFAAPNVAARYALLRGAPVALTLEGGLALPWAAFAFAPPLGVQGYLTPSCKVEAAEPARGDSCQAPGPTLIPRLGIAASWGEEHPLTLRLDGAAGWALDGSRPLPLDTLAPLDLAFAPVAHTWRAHLGVRYDRGVLPWLRVAAEADLYRVGQGVQGDTGRDLWTWAAWIGADLQTSKRTRLALGLAYWNSDQRRVVEEQDAEGFTRLVHVRSHDLLPTVDMLWTW